ncbi:MAG TPA: SpoIIE family protein phosphatase [Planctomycetota bacterium]|nr:SpoIIE family protein phosphatase [Planctomycetota bacterium]
MTLTLTPFQRALENLLSPLPPHLPLGVRLRDSGAWLREPPHGAELNRMCAGNGSLGVTLCVPAGSEALLDLGESLVAAAAQLAELEEQREGLCEELATSYESLSAVFDIGGDPALLLSPARALAKVLDHAVAFEPGIEGAIWLAKSDDTIEPTQWRTPEPPVPRDRGHGIVGRVLRERRGIIVNSRGSGWGEEPELRSARRVAAAPLLARGEAKGALVVWHAGHGSFDSRLMGLLTTLCSQAALILEQERLRVEAVAGEKLRREIEIGSNIQQVLLLGRTPADVTGLEIGTLARASRQVDGDFFGFFHHGNGVFDIVLGDVMGKGIPAALVGAAVKSQFQRFASTTGPAGRKLPCAEPAEIVAAVHDQVSETLIELGRFVTAIYARFDVNRGTMTYVDCGHTDALHHRADVRKVDLLHTKPQGRTNLPLGFARETRYEQVTVPFGPGDTFLFYSDGLTEARAPGGTFFGVDAVASALARGKDQRAQALVDRICGEVERFSGSVGIHDDLTCIAVRVTGKPPACRLALEVENVPGSLAQVRRFVSEVSSAIPGCPFHDEHVAELHLALTEAASNVFDHAYHGGAGTLRLEALWNESELRFRLLDRGTAFDPAMAKPPRFDGTTDGGFGVYIIREIMDVFDYTRGDGGTNVLELVKRFPGKEGR